MLALEDKVDEIAAAVRRTPDVANQLSGQAYAVLMHDIREASESGLATSLQGIRQLSELFGSIPVSQTSTESTRTLTQPTVEAVRSAVHLELQAVLQPALESITQTQGRHERLSRDVKDIIDALSTQAAVQSSSSGQDVRPVATEPQDEMVTANDGHQILDRPPSPVSTQSISQDHKLQPVKDWMPSRRTRETSATWTYWRRLGWMGIIRIEINRHSTFVMGRYTTYTTFRVRFWPSWRLAGRRCIALKYTTEPSSGAYYQLAPSIATFSIIPLDAEVWHCIHNGDVPGLRHLFSSGLAAPNDQDEKGRTLLHVRHALDSIT